MIAVIVVEAHVVDAVLVAARVRVVDVGRDEVVVRARKAREALEGGLRGGRQSLEGAEAVPCRRGGRWERRRGRGDVDK